MYTFFGMLVTNALTPKDIHKMINSPTTIGTIILTFLDIKYPPNYVYSCIPVYLFFFNFKFFGTHFFI